MAARITRQQIEVLISNIAAVTHNESVTDTLALTSTATHSNILLRSVSHTLSLSQTVSTSDDLLQSVSHTLTLTDKANILHQPETHTLSLSHLATAIVSHNPAVSHSLGLTDSATFEDRRQIIVPTDVLALTQTVHCNIKDVSVTDTLDLQQATDWRGPRYQEIIHRLFLTQSGHDVSKDQRVFDKLNLISLAGLAKSQLATSVLTLSDLAYNSHAASSALALTQTTIGGKGAIDGQRMAITQSLSAAGSHFTRPLSQGLGLIDGASYYILKDCTLRQYTPFISAAGGPFTPPPAIEPATERTTLALTYPFVSPSTTLVLRNPEYGDRSTFVPELITRRTMGGSYIVFSDPAWPKVKTKKYTIRLLKPSVVAAFTTFVRETVGKEIGLLDYDNQQWRGVITNPDSAITQDDRSHWTINIEFEGELA